MSRKGLAGFTLIELMIAVAIVGIIAAIAWPSYQESVRKSRRADATTTLLQIQQAQERWRANNNTYATLTQLSINTASPSGYYTMAVTGNTATTYTATATATGVQAKDTACATITLTQAGPDVADAAKKKCWGQ